MITLEVTGAQTAGVWAEKLGGQLPAVITRAMNRAIGTGRTWTRKRIVEETGIQSKYVARNLRLTRATHSYHVATLAARHSRIPLVAYFNRGFRSGKGIGGLAYRLGALPAHAFFAEVGVGRHRGIYQRRGPARTPIVEQLGPGMPEVITNRLIFEALRGPVRDAYEKRLAHELDRAIQGQPADALPEAA